MSPPKTKRLLLKYLIQPLIHRVGSQIKRVKWLWPSPNVPSQTICSSGWAAQNTICHIHLDRTRHQTREPWQTFVWLMGLLDLPTKITLRFTGLELWVTLEKSRPHAWDERWMLRNLHFLKDLNRSLAGTILSPKLFPNTATAKSKQISTRHWTWEVSH